ncbi:hypothetical protein [Blautia hominis]
MVRIIDMTILIEKPNWMLPWDTRKTKRDREGEFEPKLIPKYQRDIFGIEEKSFPSIVFPSDSSLFSVKDVIFGERKHYKEVDTKISELGLGFKSADRAV